MNGVHPLPRTTYAHAVKTPSCRLQTLERIRGGSSLRARRKSQELSHVSSILSGFARFSTLPALASAPRPQKVQAHVVKAPRIRVCLKAFLCRTSMPMPHGIGEIEPDPNAPLFLPPLLLNYRRWWAIKKQTPQVFSISFFAQVVCFWLRGDRQNEHRA